MHDVQRSNFRLKVGYYSLRLMIKNKLEINEKNLKTLRYTFTLINVEGEHPTLVRNKMLKRKSLKFIDAAILMCQKNYNNAAQRKILYLLKGLSDYL